jgi:predicted ATPase/class 3 adenylate cyclase
MATVTFLFSDIEGSTRLWQAHTQAMPAALARHDEIVFDAVTAAGGTVFKHTGDGVAAVFESAPAALTAATDIHRRLAPETNPDVGPIRVRIGVHTGEAESRRDDWFGLTVNRTARIMAAGHGGQTLLSRATAELVADRRLELRDLGEHRLSGLDRSERIYQLCAPGLSAEFPALTTEVAVVHLPHSLTELIGRDPLIAHVRSRLGAGPVVTLTGVGGVGKTTLALAVASEPPEGIEGVWFCDLVPVTEAERVAATVAAAVGLPADDATQAADRVAQWIGDRSVLLVVDNCEHVLDGAARLVEKFTVACPGLTVLATSRAPLGVTAEQVIPVSPLESDAAVELLRRRAEAAGAGRIDDRRVAELCSRLDRLPLAIELAAARLPHLSVDDILTRLDERFRLLSARRGDPRHATLLATIDWSYQLLEPDEQAMLRTAGVFTSRFDLAAAAAVWGGDEYDAIDLVGSLVSKSLLIAEVDGAGTTGYRLLETVRAFAHERAAELGESEALAQEHAEHYLRQSLAQPPVTGDRQPWTYVLEQDPGRGFQDPNRPQAVGWLVAHDRLVDAARFASRLLLVKWYRPDSVEGILRRPEVADMLDDADERALYLAASALQANMVGRWDEIRDFAEAALALEPHPHTAAIAAGLAAQMAAIRGDDRVEEFVSLGLERLPAEAVELRQFLRERRCDDIIRRRLDDGIRLLDELHAEGSVWATFELLMCCVLTGRDPEPLIAGMTKQQLDSQFGYRASLARAFVAAAAADADEAIPLLTRAGATALRFRGSLFEHDVLVGCAILAEAQGRYEEASRMLAAVGGSTRTPASFLVYRWCRDRVRERLPRERVDGLRAEMSGRDAASVLSEELARLGRAR